MLCPFLSRFCCHWKAEFVFGLCTVRVVNNSLFLGQAANVNKDLTKAFEGSEFVDSIISFVTIYCLIRQRFQIVRLVHVGNQWSDKRSAGRLLFKEQHHCFVVIGLLEESQLRHFRNYLYGEQADTLIDFKESHINIPLLEAFREGPKTLD